MYYFLPILIDQAQEASIDNEPILSHLEEPTTLCNIAEELRCHVLSFLSYSEIICCALVRPLRLQFMMFLPTTSVLIGRFKDLSNDV
jgi:hypothetical protein